MNGAYHVADQALKASLDLTEPPYVGELSLIALADRRYQADYWRKLYVTLAIEPHIDSDSEICCIDTVDRMDELVAEYAGWVG